jgi:hypothetical protein
MGKGQAMKRFAVELPSEILYDHDVGAIFRDGYVGTLGVRPGDFLRNTTVVFGEHDPTHAESQRAVARLVELVRRVPQGGMPDRRFQTNPPDKPLDPL